MFVCKLFLKIIFILSLINIGYGQQKDKKWTNINNQYTNDKLLETLLNDENFCKYVVSYLTCKDCDTLYLIDTLGYFNKSKYITNSIPVVVSKIEIIPLNNRIIYLLNNPCYSFVVNNIQKKKNTKRYRIHHKLVGEDIYGFTEYKLKKNTFIKKKFEFHQM